MSKLDVDVVLLPQLLTPEQVDGRSVVAFDVLRATTTLTTALEAGFSEVRLHPSLDAARSARTAEGRGLLLGEHKCLKPEDFDYGNSPGQFAAVDSVAGQIGHMATTNGTRAVLRAFECGVPAAVLIGCLLNRGAVAERLVAAGREKVTLLCAGTEGQVSFEDLLGCGVVLDALVQLDALGRVNDAGLMAMGTWTWSAAGLLRHPEQSVRHPEQSGALPVGLKLAAGARNLFAAGLGADVAYAARVDTCGVVGTAERRGDAVVVRRLG